MQKNDFLDQARSQREGLWDFHRKILQFASFWEKNLKIPPSTFSYKKFQNPTLKNCLATPLF